MIILKRFAPYWSLGGVTLLLYIGMMMPSTWGWIIAGLVLVPIIFVIVVKQPQWRIEYFGFSISMIVLLLSSYIFILIQESVFLNYTIFGLTLILFFLFTKNLIVFLYNPAKYIPYSLEHISTYSNIVTSFFIYVSVFTFFVLGAGRMRYIMLATLLGTALVVWQTFWIQKIPWKRARWYLAVITMVMVEGVWALHFWPVSYLVSGLLLTIFLYILLHLSRLYVTDSLTRKRLTRYLLTAGITVTALLVTARWI